MAGRKPKPTALKKLEGNPGKRKLNTKEPVPGKGMPDCPKWLLPEAKEEWKRLCQKLSEMGVLTEVDMAAFAAYCQRYTDPYICVVAAILQFSWQIQSFGNLIFVVLPNYNLYINTKAKGRRSNFCPFLIVSRRETLIG